jgi:hypothetical protein
LGIVAFIWAVVAICIALAKPSNAISCKNTSTIEGTKKQNSDSDPLPYGRGLDKTIPVKRMWLWGILAGIAALFIRMGASDLGVMVSNIERVGVYIIMFAMPAIVWFVLFIVTCGAMSSDGKSIQSNNTPLPLSVIMLGGGLLGFLVHNCIDMAYFQPGVATCFWAVTALAISLKHCPHQVTKFSFDKNIFIKTIIPLLLLAVLFCLWLMEIIPFHRSYGKLKEAQRWALINANLDEAFKLRLVSSNSTTQWAMAREQAIHLAKKAGQLNKLDPDGPYFAGELFFQQWRHTLNSNDLTAAVNQFQEAIRRDRANYSYYRDLSRLYQDAVIMAADQKDPYQKNALEYLERAIERYPVKSELLIEHGRILMEMGHKEKALDSFEKAVQMEEEFLNQQRIMWPEQADDVWRLRPELRKYAEKQIEILRKDSR